MKFLAQYSTTKFSNLSFDAQIKALHKLLRELEYHVANPMQREAIITQLGELEPLCKEELPPRLKDLLAKLSKDPFRLLRALTEYQGSKSKKDSQILLKTGDGTQEPDPVAQEKASQILIIADNLRSVFNVGSLFRVAECLAVKKVLLCGITPTPNHPNMAKTALGTCERMAWQHYENTTDALQQVKASGYRIYALETAEPSQSVFECKYQLPMALVVGNEALGIDPIVLAQCDEIIYLPVLGWKNSLNVSVAASVALYQIIFGETNAEQ